MSYGENKTYKSKNQTGRFTSSWKKIKNPKNIGKAPFA